METDAKRARGSSPRRSAPARQRMKRERPILWEEDERYQRAAALLISTVFILWVAGFAVFSLWRREWSGLWWLGEVVASILMAIVVWSGGAWLIVLAAVVSASICASWCKETTARKLRRGYMSH